MRRRGLHTAVAKLEAKRRNRRSPRPIIFALYPEEEAGEIIGLQNGRDNVPRLFGEACLTAFAERASRALNGARIMFAQYALPEPQDAILAPVAVPVAPIPQVEAEHVRDFFQTAWLGGR